MRREDLGREEVDHHDDIDDICPCFQGRRVSLDYTVEFAYLCVLNRWSGLLFDAAILKEKGERERQARTQDF